ncbi:hypothetical protein GIX45_07865 [Erwinia sp. CPCC 100877]|nr:hypothetical protein [Erwinia sp. CPCC 100877]
MYAADRRLRLRIALQPAFFAHYDVIIVGTKEAADVMTELSILSSTGSGVVKHVQPALKREAMDGLSTIIDQKQYDKRTE